MTYKNYFILTGAMGGGKTTLLDTIEQEHITIMKEPAREILKSQRRIAGRALPEANPELFSELLLAHAIEQYESAQSARTHTVLFDRGIPDNIAYGQFFKLDISHYERAATIYRYHPTVFFLPPWEEIYTTDDERKMTYNEAVAFSEILKDIYIKLGYTVLEVPKGKPRERRDFLLNTIATLTSAR